MQWLCRSRLYEKELFSVVFQMNQDEFRKKKAEAHRGFCNPSVCSLKLPNRWRWCYNPSQWCCFCWTMTVGCKSLARFSFIWCSLSQPKKQSWSGFSWSGFKETVRQNAKSSNTTEVIYQLNVTKESVILSYSLCRLFE